MPKELEHFIIKKKETIREAENTGNMGKCVKKARLSQNGSEEYQSGEW